MRTTDQDGGTESDPVDVESFNNCLQDSNSAEEAYEKYTQSSVFEEFSYDSNYPELYPVPRSYANYSSEGPRGYEDSIEPPLRAAVLSLKDKKEQINLLFTVMIKKRL